MKEIDEIEVVDFNIEPNDLVSLDSKNNLQFQIDDVKQMIIQKVKEYNIESMKPTKENKSTLKGILSELRKLKLAFEDHRKKIQADVMRDFDKFHDLYKKEILTEIDKGINLANERTKIIEKEEIELRKVFAQKYFDKKMKSTPIEYANKLSDININYNLVATTEPRMRAMIDAHFDNIIESLVVINTQNDIPRLLAIWTTNGFKLSDALKELAIQIEKENKFKEVEEVNIPKPINEIDEIEKPEEIVEAPVFEEIKDKYNYTLKLTSVTEDEINDIMIYLSNNDINYDIDYTEDE